MRKLFNIADDTETRVWNKYMSNTYEHLSKKENTVQDAGLYQGQVGDQVIYDQCFYYVALGRKQTMGILSMQSS